MTSSVVCISKNGVILPVESLRVVETPFEFISGTGKRFFVGQGDTPVYFQRKRMKIHKGRVVEHYVYRICVGCIRQDGTSDRYWLDADGNYIGLNTEPLKKCGNQPSD